MKLLALLLVLGTTNAFACWNMKAVLSVDETELKIDQKVDHDKTYSFPSGSFIYNIKVASEKNRPAHIPKKPGSHFIEIDIVEKIGTTLKPVSKAQMLVLSGQEATMTKQDNETKQTTSMKVTLTEI